MNKEVLKTKNLNNFGHVSVNSDHSLFVKKYYDFFKYKLHPNEGALNGLLSPFTSLKFNRKKTLFKCKKIVTRH